MSDDSEDSEIDFIAEYDIEIEREEPARELLTGRSSPTSSEDVAPHADDPLADEEWTAKYDKEREADEELERKLKDRFNGKVEVREWCLRCKCSNCGIASLQNISECYCCSELEGCIESMKSDLVLQDLFPDDTLTCITEHPGFQAVCLQKWSLRLAAGKYKTKGKQVNRQTGSEESFLRGVSYREFSRLVYGMLGSKRIPLPACAYMAIKKQFPVNKDESLTGFDLDEED
ncbi:hypothetical protein AWC38_SpisGene21396 [Stylophora pistillata]|uniref:P2X purinoceptor 7 n=1 Tax=Stylophora pistillata TaxID=50429 RepID=A0A2B4RDW6_STYPI|nr:hypothetical protein AWC38_SpisGene21396 [Stylophora pistillata]